MVIPNMPPAVHTLFEALSYFLGARVYYWQAGKYAGHGPFSAPLSLLNRIWLAAGAIAGAALGSKLVYWLQYPTLIESHWNDPAVLFGGKTIVGGLLGGLAGVEIVKWVRGISRSTGDDFVVPLIVGMSIGRVGCLLAGLADNTYGIETSMPWAVTYSDGVPRHPAPLYEILFLLVFLPWVAPLRRSLPQSGDTFKIFLTSYLAFRLVNEFIKPPFGNSPSPLEHNATQADLYAHVLSGIQMVCVAGLLYYLLIATRRLSGMAWRR